MLRAAAVRFGARCRVNGSCTSSLAALTFDDGPDTQLDRFLAALSNAQVRATFFVVGEQVDRDPGRLRQTVAAGHEVGVHAYRHLRYPLRHPRDAMDDLRRAISVIEDASGTSPSIFRPPYGLFSRVVSNEASRLGLEKVLWSRWGPDWQPKSTPQSVLRGIGCPQGGDIVLLHDSDRYAVEGSWRNALEAIPSIVDRAGESGIRFRPLGELLRI